MKMNKAGFTLVELLAAMVILAILMGVAIPNVVGVINRQKNNAYVEDAKRFVARARTTFAADVQINKTNNTCMTLEYLDNGDFDAPPNGGVYLRHVSYVRWGKDESNNYHYYVYLVECVSCDETQWNLTGNSLNGMDLRGIQGATYDDLKKVDNPNDVVIKNSKNDDALNKTAPTKDTTGCDGGVYYDNSKPHETR